MNDVDGYIALLAERQQGVVELKQIQWLGVTRKQVRGLLDRGQLVEILPRAYRLGAGTPSFAQTAMAATLLAGPGAVASHRAAANLHGVPGISQWAEVTVPHGRRIEVPGVLSHRARALPEDDLAEVQDVPVTAPARMLLDLADVFHPERLGRALDHCLIHKLVTRADLDRRTAVWARGQPGIPKLRELLAAWPISRRPIGSEFELDLYRVLDAAGIERPEPQCRVVLPDGTVRYIDFGYPRVRFGLEAAGYIWHGSRGAWERDRARHNELTAAGWDYLIITWGLLHHHPDQVADLVRRSLAARS